MLPNTPDFFCVVTPHVEFSNAGIGFTYHIGTVEYFSIIYDVEFGLLLRGGAIVVDAMRAGDNDDVVSVVLKAVDVTSHKE